jgi:hypothetical protein
VPPEVIRPFAKTFDTKVYALVRTLVGMEGDARFHLGTHSGDIAKRRMHLPARLGGFGLASAVDTSSGAYIASLHLTGHLLLPLLRGPFNPAVDGAAVLPSLQAALDGGALKGLVNPLVTGITCASVFDNPQPDPDQPPPPTQRLIAAERSVMELQSLTELLDSQSRAELISGGGEGAAYLYGNPAVYAFRMNDGLFKVLVLHRLGFPVCDPLPVGCPLCNKPYITLNEAGSHVHSCMQGGPGGAKGHRAASHNIVLTGLIHAMQYVDRSCGVRREPWLRELPGWAPRVADLPPSKSRGDILWVLALLQKQLVGDVVRAHPQVSSIPACATTAGAAAAAAHEKKIVKYSARWNFPAEEFVPLAIETGGRMHPEFRAFLRRFVLYVVGAAESYSDLTKEERANYTKKIKYLITSVSAANAKATARSLLLIREACARAARVPVGAAAPTQLVTQVAAGASGAAASSGGGEGAAAAPGAPAGAGALLAAAH